MEPEAFPVSNARRNQNIWVRQCLPLYPALPSEGEAFRKHHLYPYHSLRTVNVLSSQFGSVTDSLVVLDDSI